MVRNTKEKIQEFNVRKDSLIAGTLSSVTYSDAWGMHIPVTASPERMAKLFFEVFPSWFRSLLYVRETIAKAVGLKTSTRENIQHEIEIFSGKPGESISLFHVWERTSEELIMGENDKHLDFRLSFVAEPRDGSYWIAMVTAVQIHNLLGRLYFLPVKPVHKIIVPILLKRIAQRLISEA